MGGALGTNLPSIATFLARLRMSTAVERATILARLGMITVIGRGSRFVATPSTRRSASGMALNFVILARLGMSTAVERGSRFETIQGSL